MCMEFAGWRVQGAYEFVDGAGAHGVDDVEGELQDEDDEEERRHRGRI